MISDSSFLHLKSHNLYPATLASQLTGTSYETLAQILMGTLNESNQNFLAKHPHVDHSYSDARPSTSNISECYFASNSSFSFLISSIHYLWIRSWIILTSADFMQKFLFSTLTGFDFSNFGLFYRKK